MKLVSLLNFYDEPPAMLSACVSSLSGCCDHVIAMDGAYKLFPDGRPHSPCVQVDAIVHTAQAVKMGVTYMSPQTVWHGNEVEKRNTLIQTAKAMTTEDDWLLVVDADMVARTIPSNLRHLLKLTDCDVGTYWLGDPEWGGRHPIRYLFRAARDLHLTRTHFGYRRGNSYLWETGGLPAVETDLVIDHLDIARTAERRERADEYDRRVQVYGVEALNPQPV